MAGYSFFPAADAAQDTIWRYTAEMWGEDQADKYILELHGHLAKLANSQTLWRTFSFPANVVTRWDGTLFVSRYRHHIIFFRQFSNGSIGIVAILHERMDLPAGLGQAIEVMLQQNECK